MAGHRFHTINHGGDEMKIRTLGEIWGLGATASEYWTRTGRFPGETGATGGATGIMDSKNIQED